MSFATPAWLVALVLIPALAVAALIASRTLKRGWRRLVAERLRHSLLRGGSPLPRWLALAALLGALGCLIVALARPQGESGTQTETIRGRNVLLAFDISRSMLVTDVSPNRLDQARTIALELIDSLPDDRIGLIAFAGTSYLVAPLTVDHAAVRETIQQLDTETIPTGGTNLAGAAEMATDVFREGDIRNGALVIISDGEEHGGDVASAAMDADRAGLYIFAVAVGTDNGGFVPDPHSPDGRFLDRRGNPVLSRLQDGPLRTLATETGGRYVRATSGAAIGPMVDAAIGDLERFEVDRRKRKISVEFFQWLLVPAVLLLIAAILAGTRWRPLTARATATAGAAVAVITLLATPPPGTAAAADEPEPETPDPETRRFAELAGQARGEELSRYRLAEGSSALAAGDLRGARGALSAALLSDDPAVQAAAHHNLGNTLVESGWRALSDGEPYPGNDQAPVRLESHVARQLAAWMSENPEGSGDSDGLRRFETVLLSWTDAVRHYESAVAADPARDDSSHNAAVARRLLESLREALDQQLSAAEQQLPQPNPEQQGQPQPQPGEQEGEPQQQEGDGDQQQEDSPRDGSGDQQEQGGSGQREPTEGDEQNQNDRADEQDGPNEGESPEERARRLLRENADFEQGPPIRGRRREFRRPAKDW